MSALVHKLGLNKKLAFHDVFSIDEPELLAFVPRPAYALLLIFPVNETYEKFRIEEDKDRPSTRWQLIARGEVTSGPYLTGHTYTSQSRAFL